MDDNQYINYISDNSRELDDNSLLSPIVNTPSSPADIDGSQAPSSEEDQKKFFYSQKKGFEELGANAKMVEVLKALNIMRPSKIQSLSFKHVLEGKHCIIAGCRSIEWNAQNIYVLVYVCMHVCI